MDILHHRSDHRKISSANFDRFIPNRSAMDFGYANYMLSEGMKGQKKPPQNVSLSSIAYRTQLAEALNQNRTRILAFKDKPREKSLFPPNFYIHRFKPMKNLRLIPQTPERVLDASGLENNYYWNILDWGSNNVIAIALGNTVYLSDASDKSLFELVTVDDDNGPVTSLSWSPDGQQIAVGLNKSKVQLWDCISGRQLRTLRGGHRLYVGSMAWNDHILTSGGGDGKIINHDVRVAPHIFGTYRGHHGSVCGLKWSTSGKQLASGGGDNLLHIWDKSMAFSNSPRQLLHKLEDHTAAVKALAWCPSQNNLLASGGGIADRCIKFWNTQTGVCLNSYDCGSQISALLWSKNELELLSSHGFSSPKLTLWKYPSMVSMAELTHHTDRVLYMAQSPDGCQVASAAAGRDQTLKIWNVFGNPGATKPTPKANPEPFAYFNCIR